MRGGSDMIQLTLALKMTTTQVVETSFTVSNSPIQDYAHADGMNFVWLQSQLRGGGLGLKFSILGF